METFRKALGELTSNAILDARVARADVNAALAELLDKLRQEDIDNEVQDALMEQHGLQAFPAPLCHILSTASVHKELETFEKHGVTINQETNIVKLGGIRVHWEVYKYSSPLREVQILDGIQCVTSIPGLKRALLVIAQAGGLDLAVSDLEGLSPSLIASPQ